MALLDRVGSWFWGRRADTPAVPAKRQPSPKAELELFLKRLSPRERERFDTAFASHGGAIRSLNALEKSFKDVEERLKNARSTLNSSPPWALRQARWALGHAEKMMDIAEHLASAELRAHDETVARDAFAVRGYADHAKKQAQSLIDQLKPLVR
jgi:hypothetical protein